MSPLAITLLIIGGIVILLVIGYINHMVENRNLQRARLKAELTSQIRHCSSISERLPAQFVSPALKLLLARLQLHDSEKLLPLDRHNTTLKREIEELRAQVALGESIKVGNLPQRVLSDVKAKEIRHQLEDLHGQVSRANKLGLLSKQEAKHWVAEIRKMLINTNLELFNNLGQLALQQNQPGQARLAFERGVHYLQRLPDPAPYEAELKRLEALLGKANGLLLASLQPNTAEEFGNLEDDDWKKKQLYD